MNKKIKLCPQCGHEMNEEVCEFCQDRNKVDTVINENIPFQNIPAKHKQVVVNFSNIIEDGDEKASYYAEGLPNWSLLPPQRMVRKKGRKL